MERDELLNEIQIILNDKEEKREKRKANGDYFNIYELCGIAGKENIFSNIIANLLDPGWKHGQGNIFLKKFCNRLGIKFEDQPQTTETTETTVKREEVIPGRRPDIVIRNGSNLIVIENKTGTCDHEEQLLDYWNWMCCKKNNPCASNKILIYLTKNGEHPRCDLEIGKIYNNSDRNENPEDYKNVSSVTIKGEGNDKFILLPYSEIRDWCAHCSIIPGIPECVADAFKQYANFIELWLNNETDDVDIIEHCAKEENLDAISAIYLSGNTRNATQWVKDNYYQIIRTYIAFQFPGKAWRNSLLELKKIPNTIFSVCIEFAQKPSGHTLIGITQTGQEKYISDRDLSGELRPEFLGFNVKSGLDDCWWIVYQDINIKQIKKELEEKIKAVNKLLERNDLQEIFSKIKVSEKK